MNRPYPPQQATPPRRRRSHDPFRFQDLPGELKLLVLEHCLPTTNDVSRHWPAPIPALLRVSKQFNVDTKEVLRRWSPSHYVPDPTFLSSVPHPGVVKVEKICLSMFHDARLGVLRSGQYSQTPAADHQELITAWTHNISHFPQFETVRSILVDATPAPGWLCHEKPTWVPNIINDKSVSDRFIFEHLSVIDDLIITIAAFYQSINRDDVTVKLAGRYGQRSRAFPGYVATQCARVALDVPFVGTIVPEPSRQFAPMTIPVAINELYSERSIPREEYQRRKMQITNTKRRLLQYRYSTTSEFLFSNFFDEDEDWAMYQLERLTDFALAKDDSDENDDLDDGDETDPGYFSNFYHTARQRQMAHRKRHIDIAVSEFARGSLVCSLARDLGLATTARENWDSRREIRVSRMVFRGRQRWSGGRTRQMRSSKESSASASSLFGLMLMSAAAVLFVGVLSSDLRRRRQG